MILMRGHPEYFDYNDPKDYEEWCAWNDVDEDEGYYVPFPQDVAGGFFFEAVLEMDLETVVVDSVVHEPSKEEILVSEGPGLDYNVNSGPEMPFPGLVDSLNMPSGNFAEVDPMEPSSVLPHMSDPPVPVGVVVSGSNPPIPVFRLLLELSDLSSDSALAAEDFFLGPGSLSAWPGFVEKIRPGLGGSQPTPGGSERAPRGGGGCFM